MRFKILSLLAAMVLVAACETAPEEATDNAGSGSQTTSSGTSGSDAVSQSGSTVPEIVPGSEEDFLVIGDRVFFDFDRSDLSSEAQSALAKQAAWLLQYPQVVIQVEGHCDERGTREYNLALGERRANSVKEYLMSLGVNGDRISTISYGKERPAVDGSNDEAWAQNRRGVTRLVGGTNS
ncbi:MAG: peptidoglycan-associated lipoprotein Pal [Alphaproteobacteria bacterium]|nr:peptidoglycan-associated lipoprotein Pal [Alphaproteobacteria bacterium]